VTDAATEAAEAASSTESRRRLRIFINNDPFFAPERIMTGTEILRLAGLPEGNQLFLEVPGPGDDRPIAAEMTPTPEERLENLIAQVGTGIFSAEVQAEVERILSPGQSLEPMARARFIDAARRGLRPVALEYGPLELLLFHPS
jgi:hypothetical protein